MPPGIRGSGGGRRGTGEITRDIRRGKDAEVKGEGKEKGQEALDKPIDVSLTPGAASRGRISGQGISRFSPPEDGKVSAHDLISPKERPLGVPGKIKLIPTPKSKLSPPLSPTSPKVNLSSTETPGRVLGSRGRAYLHKLAARGETVAELEWNGGFDQGYAKLQGMRVENERGEWVVPDHVLLHVQESNGHHMILFDSYRNLSNPLYMFGLFLQQAPTSKFYLGYQVTTDARGKTIVKIDSVKHPWEVGKKEKYEDMASNLDKYERMEKDIEIPQTIMDGFIQRLASQYPGATIEFNGRNAALMAKLGDRLKTDQVSLPVNDKIVWALERKGIFTPTQAAALRKTIGEGDETKIQDEFLYALNDAMSREEIKKNFGNADNEIQFLEQILHLGNFNYQFRPSASNAILYHYYHEALPQYWRMEAVLTGMPPQFVDNIMHQNEVLMLDRRKAAKEQYQESYFQDNEAQRYDPAVTRRIQEEGFKEGIKVAGLTWVHRETPENYQRLQVGGPKVKIPVPEVSYRAKAYSPAVAREYIKGLQADGLILVEPFVISPDGKTGKVSLSYDGQGVNQKIHVQFEFKASDNLSTRNAAASAKVSTEYRDIIEEPVALKDISNDPNARRRAEFALAMASYYQNKINDLHLEKDQMEPNLFLFQLRKYETLQSGAENYANILLGKSPGIPDPSVISSAYFLAHSPGARAGKGSSGYLFMSPGKAVNGGEKLEILEVAKDGRSMRLKDFDGKERTLNTEDPNLASLFKPHDLVYYLDMGVIIDSPKRNKAEPGPFQISLVSADAMNPTLVRAGSQSLKIGLRADFQVGQEVNPPLFEIYQEGGLYHIHPPFYMESSPILVNGESRFGSVFQDLAPGRYQIEVNGKSYHVELPPID